MYSIKEMREMSLSTPTGQRTGFKLNAISLLASTCWEASQDSMDRNSVTNVIMIVIALMRQRKSFGRRKGSRLGNTVDGTK